MFNYYEESDEFLGWAFVSLMASFSRDKEKFNELQGKTNGWTEVDLKIIINGVEVPTDNFMKSVEGNMKYWAEQKAARQVESVLDNVRDKVYAIEQMLDEVSNFVKNKLENELGSKFPED